MTAEVLLVLRLIHILGGVFWAGTVIVLAGFLLPVVRSGGPAGGRVMQGIMVGRRLAALLGVATALNILSGLSLYAWDSAGFRWAWLSSGPGLVFGIGGLAAITAALLGVVVSAPTARQIAIQGRQAAESGSGAAASVIAPLQDRLDRVTVIQAALLVVAVGAMAIARYVP